MRINSVCVFCGSSPGRRPEYAAAAQHLGHALASAGKRLVYGGGDVGLMGTVPVNGVVTAMVRLSASTSAV